MGGGEENRPRRVSAAARFPQVQQRSARETGFPLRRGRCGEETGPWRRRVRGDVSAAIRLRRHPRPPHRTLRRAAFERADAGRESGTVRLWLCRRCPRDRRGRRPARSAPTVGSRLPRSSTTVIAGFAVMPLSDAALATSRMMVNLRHSVSPVTPRRTRRSGASPPSEDLQIAAVDEVVGARDQPPRLRAERAVAALPLRRHLGLSE